MDDSSFSASPPSSSRKKNLLWLLILIPVCCLCIVAVVIVGGYFYASSVEINVGYYVLESGEADTGIPGAVETAGYQSTELAGLTASDLAGIHVLFVANAKNDPYSVNYTRNMAAIESAVKDGLVLVFHDRLINNDTVNASDILPGGQDIQFTRDTGEDVDIADSNNLVVNGPGGILDNGSLDGGKSSAHGYAALSSLPKGAKVILTDGNSSHAVLFSYKYGSGYVIFSSIPLDWYLLSSHRDSWKNFSQVYAPNVIAYAGDLVPILRRIMVR